MHRSTQDFLKQLAEPVVDVKGSATEAVLDETVQDHTRALTKQNIWTHNDVSPLVLSAALDTAFGPDWFNWTYETVVMSIKSTFKTDTSVSNRQKIRALLSMYADHSMVWDSWQVFEKVIHSLNGNIPRWDVQQPLGVWELMAGVDMLNSLRDLPFSDEVRRYVAACFLTEELMLAPSPLQFAQLEISQPVIVCNTCGNQDAADLSDGTCDTCTKKYDASRGLSMKGDQNRTEKGIGKDLETVYTYDHRPVQVLWERVKDLPSKDVKTPEDAVGLQVDSLLMARDHLASCRTQARKQFDQLKGWLQ